MGYDYDTLYRDVPDALGQPSAVVIKAFENIPPAQRVLDVGCGQGRDALFLGRLGHRVVGVDISPHGIRDLKAAAQAQRLKIEGIVGDVVTFQPTGLFDVILIDRTLHMPPPADRRTVLARLLKHLCADGWLLILDEKRNIADIKERITADCETWTTILENGGTLFLRQGSR